MSSLGKLLSEYFQELEASDDPHGNIAASVPRTSVQKMVIDYFVQYPCKVRESVSDQVLLRMKKSRDRVKLTMDFLTEDPELYLDEANQLAAMYVLGMTVPPERDIKIAALVADAAPLEALSEHCKQCPANLRGMAFGCGGTIDSPIVHDTERWLVSRLPDDVKTLPGRALMQAIKDFRFDGAEIDAARARKVRYAAERPVIRFWSSLFGRKTWLSSSQVLQMLIGSGRLSPIHARLVCWFLGCRHETRAPRRQPSGDLRHARRCSIQDVPHGCGIRRYK